ncbi:hypothetical protein B0H19DRAFT_1275766 [Mycena capillaripes]|nr:hypothetical protein B0H19DRAFT_1275766 [Mycena capillaripes]
MLRESFPAMLTHALRSVGVEKVLAIMARHWMSRFLLPSFPSLPSPHHHTLDTRPEPAGHALGLTECSITTGEHLDRYMGPMSPVAHLDNSSPPYLKQWTLGPPPKSSPSDSYDGGTSQWQRLSFSPGSFKGPILSSSITSTSIMLASLRGFPEYIEAQGSSNLRLVLPAQTIPLNEDQSNPVQFPNS